MAKRALSLRCPTCRKAVSRRDPEFPFCSQRCRLIDLGKWASGEYVISTPLHQADASGEADYTVGPRRVPSPGNPKPDHRTEDDEQKRR